MPIINGQGRVAVRVAPTVYPSEFITVWKTDNAGVTASNQIRIGTTYGTHNLLVDWGDGTTSTITEYGYPVIQHTYETPGTYTVKMSGTFPGFIQNGDRLKLLQVSNWGSKAWTHMGGAFQSCSNLTITAQDVPNFSACTNMASMFQSCTSITSIPKIKNWDMSNATNIEGMFVGCTGLTSLDLSGWDLRKVTYFIYSYGVFQGCSNLVTLNVTGWQLPTATTYALQQLFYGCTKLATITGIGTWDVSKCVNTGYMFSSCNALTSLDLSTWNPISVTSVYGMFQNCQGLTDVNLSNWNLSSCTNFAYMFDGSKIMTLNASNWVLNTTNNVNMSMMFSYTSRLTSITGLNTWNTSKVTSLYFTFGFSKINTIDMSGLNLSNCTDLGAMFYGSNSLTSVNLSGVTLNTTTSVSLQSMFRETTALTTITGLNTLNTSKVTSIYFMFAQSKANSLDLSGWNLSSCTEMRYAFYTMPEVTSINVSNWVLTTNPSVNLNGYMMFYQCTKLTTITGLNTWNTIRFVGTSYMFSGGKYSSMDISGWNLSNCTDMNAMFYASSPTITSINMSGVTLNTTSNVSLDSIFRENYNLTTVIGFKELNTSKVTTLRYAFTGTKISGDLSGLNLSSCTDFWGMFMNITNLNVNVANWTLNQTSNINMAWMFYATNNNASTGLSTWDVTKVNNFGDFLIVSTLSTTEYTNMLIAWDALDLVNNLSFNGGNSKYNSSGQTARASIIANDVWTITDGGLA